MYQYDKDGQVIEVELASSLNHMNLCSFVDSGKLEKGRSSIVVCCHRVCQGRES